MKEHDVFCARVICLRAHVCGNVIVLRTAEIPRILRANPEIRNAMKIFEGVFYIIGPSSTYIMKHIFSVFSNLYSINILNGIKFR